MPDFDPTDFIPVGNWPNVSNVTAFESCNNRLFGHLGVAEQTREHNSDIIITL